MDPVTHGIAGALLGKGYFADRKGAVAIFALTLGAVFPDVDEFAVAISRAPLAMVKYHRGITHSFVAMPVWAAILAWLTIWAAGRLKVQTPSWGDLTLVIGAGISSHILLDAMTSYGTRMWTPISNVRVAWDVLFIIDFVFTTILLLPQVAAWIYQERSRSARRAAWMWVLFSIAAVGAWFAARAFGTPFHLWIAGAASITIAIVFFLPAARGWGFGVKRSAWCRAGVYVTLLYLIACTAAHHAALAKVREFVHANHVTAVRIGAIPLPPSLLDWNGEIRAPNGVFEARIDLRDRRHGLGAKFRADSSPDPYIERAMQLPQVQLYWQFARFPVIRSSADDDRHVVEFYETRFQDGRRNAPQPFTYEVVFDADGNLIADGWERNGVLRSYMQDVAPRQDGKPR